MAIKRINATLLCLFLMVFGLYAQDDPVLFSVENAPVHASEFKYIYSKTNGEKADFSKESLEEYLNLYTRFKLKVKAARDMQLDTIPALINELAGYQRQLSKSYLIDRELTEKLVREAYDRSQEEVNISHILIKVANTAAPKDSLAAYKKIMAIKKELDGGADFVQLVKTKSDDVSSRQFGGEIGYLTALQLPNLYALESAAYNTPVGEHSAPVRTNLGYHIVKVNDRQPARGEMNAAHILVRAKGNNDAAAKQKIDGIYQQLKAGASFSELAKTQSEDNKTAGKGGELGFFGINIYEPSIENAAFALKETGDYSEPFRSSLGYHIIMKLDEKEKLSYETAKNILLQKVKKDSRYKITEQAMIDRIKTESNFKENTANLNKFAKGLDQEFFKTTWEAPKTALDNPIYTIGTQTTTVEDFVSYLVTNRNLRFRANRGGKTTAEVAAKKLFNDFVNDGVIKYEESQLGVKYPEFKSLMREYEEGILLFEATKRRVWDKAAADSVGLNAFFEDNMGMYLWTKRARISVYTVKINDEKVVAKARKLAAKKSANDVLAKINKGQDFITVKEERYEKGRNKDVDAMAWKAGAVSELMDKRGNLTFIKIEEILPGRPKTLKEARGYVVADYQDHLEKKWVENLRKKYEVEINKNVLKDMTR